MIKNLRKIVEEGYDKVDYAGEFRKSTKLTAFQKQIFDKFLDQLPKNPKILDFGCGTGIPFDKYLVEKSASLTGIDISTKYVYEAKINVPKAKYIKGDFSKYNFNQVYDGLLSLYAIYHIPKDEHPDLFKKMYKLLKPHGVILVSLGTSGKDSIEEDWSGAPMVWSTHTPEKYKEIILDSRFEILEELFEGELDEKHYWILAKKK